MTTRRILLASLTLTACGADERTAHHDMSLVPAFLYVDGESRPLEGAPAPDLEVDKLVAGETVVVVTPDGEPTTWAEFGAARGTADLTCEDGGTRIRMQAQGLIPGGVYTGWVNLFVPPGLQEAGLQAFAGLGPLGAPDGAESEVIADPEGRAVLETVTPAGPLALAVSPESPEVPACMLDAYQAVVELAYHIDGLTHGAFPGNDDVVADHLTWQFDEGAVVGP